MAHGGGGGEWRRHLTVVLRHRPGQVPGRRVHEPGVEGLEEVVHSCAPFLGLGGQLAVAGLDAVFLHRKRAINLKR